MDGKQTPLQSISLPDSLNGSTTKEHNHQSNPGTPLLCNNSNTVGPPIGIVDGKSVGGEMDTTQDNGGTITYSHLPSRPSLLSLDSKRDNGSSGAETWGGSMETNTFLDRVGKISASELHGGGQLPDDPDIPKSAIHADHSVLLKQLVTKLHTAESTSPTTVNSFEKGRSRRHKKQNHIDSRRAKPKQQSNKEMESFLHTFEEIKLEPFLLERTHQRSFEESFSATTITRSPMKMKTFSVMVKSTTEKTPPVVILSPQTTAEEKGKTRGLKEPII